MTETRYEELKQIVDAWRRKVLRDLDMKLRDTRGKTDSEEQSSGLDDAETAAADLQQDLGLALMEMNAETLRRIDDAVARLSSGEYGWCAECEGEISEKRLEALPFAVRCRECEAAYEFSARRSHLAQGRIGSTCRMETTARD
jgi:DnaK suppressor protein